VQLRCRCVGNDQYAVPAARWILTALRVWLGLNSVAAALVFRCMAVQELNMEVADLLAHPTYMGASLMQVCRALGSSRVLPPAPAHHSPVPALPPPLPPLKTNLE
jgi:hypothetical protein